MLKLLLRVYIYSFTFLYTVHLFIRIIIIIICELRMAYYPNLLPRHARRPVRLRYQHLFSLCDSQGVSKCKTEQMYQ